MTSLSFINYHTSQQHIILYTSPTASTTKQNAFFYHRLHRFFTGWQVSGSFPLHDSGPPSRLLIRKNCFSAMAGYNCKCQDGNGQYNASTKICCIRDPSWDHEYHDDQVHQVHPFRPLPSSVSDTDSLIVQ